MMIGFIQEAVSRCPAWLLHFSLDLYSLYFHSPYSGASISSFAKSSNLIRQNDIEIFCNTITTHYRNFRFGCSEPCQFVRLVAFASRYQATNNNHAHLLQAAETEDRRDHAGDGVCVRGGVGAKRDNPRNRPMLDIRPNAAVH